MLKAADFRKIAREALKGNWLVAVATGFIAALLGGSIANAGSGNIAISEETQLTVEEMCRSVALDPVIVNVILAILGMIAAVAVVYTIVLLVIGGAVSLGYAKFNLNLINRNGAKIEDLFSQFGLFKKAFVMNFLRGLFIFLWSLLLVVPGIIATFSYAMAPYILYENPEMTGREALAASKELMQGNKWRLFCLSFSFIGWAILCGLTLGIGGLFLHPYVEASWAAFYREIKWEKLKHEAGME